MATVATTTKTFDGLYCAHYAAAIDTQQPRIYIRPKISCLCLAYICECVHTECPIGCRKQEERRRKNGKRFECLAKMKKKMKKRTNIGNRLDSHNIWLSLRFRVEMVGSVYRTVCAGRWRHLLSQDTYCFRLPFRFAASHFTSFVSVYLMLHTLTRHGTEWDGREKNEERRETRK